LVTSDFAKDTLLSNNFTFKEWIASAYTSVGGTYKGVGFLLGLRAERSQTHAHQAINNADFKRMLPNFFPNAQVSYRISPIHDIQFSYSRRINRPDLRSINPITDYSDPLNLRIGNPRLFPEYTNSFEFNHSVNGEKNTLLTSLYYRSITNITQWVREIKPTGVSVVTYQNIAVGANYGAEMIYRAEIAEYWNLTPSINVYRQEIKGSTEASGNVDRSQTTWFGKFMSNIRLLKTVDIQLSGNYFAPTISAMGKMKPMYSVDAAIAKDVFKKNGNLSFNITDIFDHTTYSNSLIYIEFSGCSDGLESW
jgi:outer membrane receptor protein involved in Fe transport